MVTKPTTFVASYFRIFQSSNRSQS